MDKLKLAHEMALAIQGTKLLHDMELVSDMAWRYADAMQAEADKRVNKERPDVLKEEWQPDWSQAPDTATAWEYLGYGSARWHTTTKGMYRAAGLFGYSGTDMLLVERQNGF